MVHETHVHVLCENVSLLLRRVDAPSLTLPLERRLQLRISLSCSAEASSRTLLLLACDKVLLLLLRK